MKTKVLMLGWEYPPHINGGLGVASQGLAHALSAKLGVRLLVPSGSISAPEAQLEIIPVDQLEIDNLERSGEYREINQIEKTYIQSQLRGYGHPVVDLAALQQPPIKIKEHKPEISPADAHRSGPFQPESLYGPDIAEQVFHYGEIVSDLAQQKNDFDLIHAHDWMTFPAGMEIKAKTGKSLVLHVHSLEYDRSGATGDNWVFDLEKRAMEEADLVIAVSAYTSGVITDIYKIDADKVLTLHNAPESVVSYRRQKPFPEKLVIFIGRLSPQKDPFAFLDMAQMVREAIPSTRFVLAGDGELLPSLSEEIAKRKMGLFTHLTGFLTRDKLQDLLAIADVLVLPSRSEPFGLVALEAAQFGVPVIISEWAGAAEVLPSAIVADSGTGRGFADEVIFLLEDPKKCKTLSSTLQKEVANLNWEEVASRLVDAYQRIL